MEPLLPLLLGIDIDIDIDIDNFNCVVFSSPTFPKISMIFSAEGKKF
jgi:hypothetical protein